VQFLREKNISIVFRRPLDVDFVVIVSFLGPAAQLVLAFSFFLVVAITVNECRCICLLELNAALAEGLGLILMVRRTPILVLNYHNANYVYYNMRHIVSGRMKSSEMKNFSGLESYNQVDLDINVSIKYW
jgi:hypothetical protein